MSVEDISATRRALVTSGKLLEALASSPDQDEDVSLYAIQHFDRIAVLYVQQLDQERPAREKERAGRSEARSEARPRYSSLEGARARVAPVPDEGG
jgi:hypothetical protein